MKSIKKIITSTVYVIALLGIFLLGAFIFATFPKALQTADWKGAVTAFYSDEAPESYGGADIGTNAIRVGKTAGGGDIFSFVRLPLGVDFFADEITEAKLFLYAEEAATPKKLLIGAVGGRWTLYTSTCAEAMALVDNNGLKAATRAILSFRKAK